jgi:hypothetical protein
MVLIDCAKKSVKLTTPEGKEVEFVAEPVVTAKGVANCTKVNQLDASQGSEVPVVLGFEASSHRDSLDRSRFWRREVKWLINWSCHHSCLTYITYSLSLN